MGLQQKQVVKPKQQVKPKQGVVQNKHRAVNYNNKGYRSINHARQCRHVQTAIKHHSISDEEMFLSILASGISILAAVVSIGIAL